MNTRLPNTAVVLELNEVMFAGSVTSYVVTPSVPSTARAMSRTSPSASVRTTPTLSVYLTVLTVCSSTGCAGSLKSIECRPA